MKKDTLIVLTADEGKVLKRVVDDEILGTTLTLGKGDKPTNYVEVDAPPEEENMEPIPTA